MHCEPIAFSKNKSRQYRVDSQGFTLLEVLVALFMLTIIISLIFGSFQGVFSNADHINRGSDLYEMGNACLSRITRDLTAIHVMDYPRYQPPDIDDEPDIFRVEGILDPLGGQTFSRLRFSSLAHLPLNQDTRGGIARIVYYVQEDENDGYVLRRADHLYPYPEFEPNQNDPILCEQVRDFRLKYYSLQDDEQEEWNSDSDDYDYNTPAAITITLAVGDAQSPAIFTTGVALPIIRTKKGDE